MMFPYVFHMLWNTYIIRSHLALTLVTTHYYRCLTLVDILRTNWCVLLMYPLVVVLMYPSPYYYYLAPYRVLFPFVFFV